MIDTLKITLIGTIIGLLMVIIGLNAYYSAREYRKEYRIIFISDDSDIDTVGRDGWRIIESRRAIDIDGTNGYELIVERNR